MLSAKPMRPEICVALMCGELEWITAGWPQRCLFQEQCKRAKISDNSHSDPSRYLPRCFLEAEAPPPEPSWVRARRSQQLSPEKFYRSRVYRPLLGRMRCVNLLASTKPSAVQRYLASNGNRAQGDDGVLEDDVNTRSQWSVHPIDAIQRLLLTFSRSAARPGRASTMQAPSQLTPTARSAMAVHIRQTHLVVNSRPGSVGKILCRRYVHSGPDARQYRDNSRCPLSALRVSPFFPPGDRGRLNYRNSFYGSAKQR